MTSGGQRRWKAMPAVVCTCYSHACCEVRGALVVLGEIAPAPGRGSNQGFAPTSRMEMLPKVAGTFVELPPLSCGAVHGAAAIAVDESDSALRQVLLLEGRGEHHEQASAVRLVDLATGVCTPQAPLSTRARTLRRLGCRMGALFAQKATAYIRQRCEIVCSCVAVRVRYSHWELEVLVEASVVSTTSGVKCCR
jgi:hypothetical protein